MRILSFSKRRSRSIAILLCVIPLVGLGQDPASEALSLSSIPPTPGELSPFDSPGLAPLTSASPAGETDVGVGASEELITSEMFRGELVGSELLASKPAAVHEFPFGYNLRQSNTSWLLGGGNDFGIVSLESFPSLSPGSSFGIVAGMGFHFLSGPLQTDMPPRLFDFQIGIQHRKWTSDTFGYDLAARVGAFSDFEGSARKGVRYPGHAVGYYRWNPQLDLVFGIECLDRDDISLLPVAGVILRPRDDLRLELVFPRPRVELRMGPKHSLYLAGELGGGTWAIERVTMIDDNVTYRDVRLLLGISHGKDGERNAGIEIGYVFSRDLSYRSGVGNYAPDDTLLLRLTQHY